MQNFDAFFNSINTNTTSSVRYVGVTRATPCISLAEALDSKDQRRMDIQFTNDSVEGFRAKYSIWFKNEPTQSKSGKFRFIDKRGNVTIWVDGVDGVTDQNFDAASARKALVGEGELVEFMKAWTGYNKNIKVDFPQFDIQKIVDGDMSELQAFLDKLAQVEVVIAVGVKDDKYQEVLNLIQPAWTLPSGKDEKSIQQVAKTLEKYGKAIAKSTSSAIFGNVLLTKYEEFSKDSASVKVVNDAEEMPF